MRKFEREIVNLKEIVDVIERCDTLRIGLCKNNFPYVIPVSFGYEVINEEVIFYVHGAKDGKKHDIILTNQNACVELDICHRFVEVAHGITCEYESVIGYGSIEKIEEKDEMVHALEMLLEHCHYAGYSYSHDVLSILTIYKIKIDKITGKRRTV